MITRDVAQIRNVTAFDTASYDASCGSLNGDSTANLVGGLIIDRLGLGRNYNAVKVVADAIADLGTSTVDAHFGAISAWLFHSSTTCASDFDRFSTDSERPRQPLFLLNTTSTLASGYMATSTAVGTFGTFSATATGGARASYGAHYDLAGANRYLQPFLLVEAYASSSGGTRMRVGTDLLFGEPDQSQYLGPGATTAVTTTGQSGAGGIWRT